MTRKIKMHNTTKTISAIERTDMIIKGTNLLGFVLERLLLSEIVFNGFAMEGVVRAVLFWLNRESGSDCFKIRL